MTNTGNQVVRPLHSKSRTDMNRPLEFRAWNPLGNMTNPFTLGDKDTNISLIIENQWPIMQFIGSLDRKGNKIFEDDIIALYDFSGNEVDRFVVKYNLNSFGYYLVSDILESDHPTHHWYTSTLIEVIGDIHRNPELIK